jgi:tRNA pseudouridine38-40 synthase
MREDFHARFSATARRYSYYVGTDAEAASPFRRHTEWVMLRPFDHALLDEGAALIVGAHCFRGFAVRGTAPASDDHRCVVHEALWRDRPGGLVFEIEANRFLHHMMDVAAGRRPLHDLADLLVAADNDAVSPPAPSHGLFLDRVQYPADLYLSET